MMIFHHLFYVSSKFGTLQTIASLMLNRNFRITIAFVRVQISSNNQSLVSEQWWAWGWKKEWVRRNPVGSFPPQSQPRYFHLASCGSLKFQTQHTLLTQFQLYWWQHYYDITRLNWNSLHWVRFCWRQHHVSKSMLAFQAISANLIKVPFLQNSPHLCPFLISS